MIRQNQTVSIPGFEGMWTFKEVQKQNLYVHIIQKWAIFLLYVLFKISSMYLFMIYL